MKILLTGFTQRMVNSQRLVYDYLTSVYLLREALRALGHTVEHRVVTWGESLKGYDLALVGVGPPRSFTAQHVLGSAWAYQHVPSIFYADDWSVVNLGTSVRSTLRNWASYLKFIRGLGVPEPTVLQQAGVKELFAALVEDTTATLLAPMFPWGNHELLRDGNFAPRLATWDPTPLVKLPEPRAEAVPGSRKLKRWINATLQKHEGWVEGLKLGWPVETLGNRRAGASYIAETHVIQLYRESWGVLCPRYARAGSGWWRVRYHWAALAGAILLADRSDTGWMNGGDAYHVSGKHVEQLGDGELAQVARGQATWFFENTARRDATLGRLDVLLQKR